MREADFRWFVENYQSLFEAHGKCYLIIHDKNVAETAGTPKDAVGKACEMFPDGDYIIQLCNGNKTAYTNYVSNWQLAVI